MRLLGIDPAQELDPEDPLAFPTGLTFIGPGIVGITMTPIVVPEPQWGALLAIAFGFIAIRYRKR